MPVAIYFAATVAFVAERWGFGAGVVVCAVHVLTPYCQGLYKGWKND